MTFGNVVGFLISVAVVVSTTEEIVRVISMLPNQLGIGLNAIIIV